MTVLSGSELKSEARRIITSQAPRIFIITAVFKLITTVLTELQSRLAGTEAFYIQLEEQLRTGGMPTLEMLTSNVRISGILLAYLVMLFIPVIETGYASYCLKLSRDVEAEPKSLLDGFLFFVKIIAIHVISMLIASIGMILFVFPGVMAVYAYRQAYYIMLDDPEKGIISCLRESRRLMRGNKVDLFLIDISFLGWFIVDLIVVLYLPLPFMFPIIQIWLAPYAGLTYAQYYNRLIGRLAV